MRLFAHLQLTELIATERARIEELQKLVVQEQRKVDKQRALQQTVESNMIRLYEAAKVKADHRQQRLQQLRSSG